MHCIATKILDFYFIWIHLRHWLFASITFRGLRVVGNCGWWISPVSTSGKRNREHL